MWLAAIVCNLSVGYSGKRMSELTPLVLRRAGMAGMWPGYHPEPAR
jgi:hypothetical protein